MNEDAGFERWVVVLAGGIGSRFWPASTPGRPKQFLPLATARPLIVGLQGPSWGPAVLVFQILITARLVQLLALPLRHTLFAVQRPHVVAVTQIGLLPMFLLLALWLIPSLGAAGSATALLAVSLIALGALALCVFREVRRGQSSAVPSGTSQADVPTALAELPSQPPHGGSRKRKLQPLESLDASPGVPDRHSGVQP